VFSRIEHEDGLHAPETKNRPGVTTSNCASRIFRDGDAIAWQVRFGIIERLGSSEEIREAGFDSVRWHRPVVSTAGVQKYGQDYSKDLVELAPIIGIECRRSTRGGIANWIFGANALQFVVSCIARGARRSAIRDYGAGRVGECAWREAISLVLKRYRNPVPYFWVNSPATDFGL